MSEGRQTQLDESAVKSALQLAYGAESDLLGEYQLMRQSWERNPTMSACAAGVKALRACIALLETLDSSD